MARQSMADLIAFVRDLINDPFPGTADCPTVFTNDQIQQVLDLHRYDAYQHRLEPADDVQADGTIEWKTFYGVPFWETDFQLQGNTFAFVTADSYDAIAGTWTFLTSQTLPIRVTGKHYDVYHAAVDLLMRWKAKLTLQYDFSTTGGSFTRSQRISNLDGLIKSYRQRMSPRKLTVVRRDGASR